MSSQELQKLNNQLDKLQRKLSKALGRHDEVIATEARKEIVAQTKKINSLKSQREKQVYTQKIGVQQLPFKRALTKAEQADLGKLKKAIKGLIVVHPLTALGKELGLTDVTGFAPSAF